MSLAALLMGVANRAGEVNRRNEQRKYSEELYGKQAQSEYLMKQISDPSLPDEERQQHEKSFEQLWGLKPGMVDFAKKMTPMFRQLVKQQAPGMVQDQIPSAPAAPAGPIGPPAAGGGLGNVPAEPANIQPPLGALPRATPTLGTPPPPPPAMQAPNTELGRRQLQQHELIKQGLSWIKSMGLPPELESQVISHTLGVPPAYGVADIRRQSALEVATQNNLTKMAIAQQNLKQGTGPVYEFVPETGPAVQVRQLKSGGWMNTATGEPYDPKVGEILTHVGDKTKWFIGSDLQPRAISEKAIQTRQARTGTSAATMGFQVQPRQSATATPEMSDAEAQFWAKQMQTAEDLKALSPKGRAKVMSVKAASGEGLQRELTSQGKQSIEKIEPVIGSMDILLGKLDPYKTNNQRGYFTIPYLKYRTGVTTPEGDIGNSIASLELVKILGAMPYIKGRPNQIFIDAIWKHLPNTIIDSPMTIHDKLTKAKRLLEAYREAALKYEVKGAPPPSPEDLRAAERTVAEIEGTGSSSSNTEDIKRRLKEKYK